MAYNYLGLVNEICAKVNEVPLTESTFSTETGVYSDAKNSVNRAIDFIHLDQRYWRFNHQTTDLILTAGVSRYDFPANVRVIDFGSFRIRASDTLGNSSQKLKLFDYDEYLKLYIDDEYNTASGRRSLPDKVCKTNSEQFVIHPVPDKAYTLTYENYVNQTALVNPTDVPSVPEKYRLAIFYGAMGEMYDFRDDEQKADKYFAMRDKIIEDMRKEEINRHVYAWSNYVVK